MCLVLVGCNDPNTTNEESPDTAITGGQDTGDTLNPAPENVLVGVPCVDTPEFCESPGLCSTLLPGGYCTVGCEDTACPMGSECRTINNFPFCMRSCSANSDCRAEEGYACIDGVCDKGCESNAECPNTGEVCKDGACQPGCVSNEGCASGQLCQDSVCVTPAGDFGLGELCLASSQCSSGICLSAADGGVCAEACTTQGCTMPSWGCRGATPIDGTQALNLCVPPGSFTIEEIQPSVDPQAFRTYLFTAPPDAVSFLILVEATDISEGLSIVNIVAPDGRVYADGGDPRTGFTQPMRLGPNLGSVAALVPYNSDPNLQMQAGTWKFSVASFGFAELSKLRVYIKRANGATNGEVPRATYDLNIFIAPGALNGLSASSAPGNAHMQTALNRLTSRYWNPGNIMLGDVRYYDINSAYGVIETENEIKAMLRDASAQGSEGGLNVFWIRDFAIPGYNDARGNSLVLGLAGGLPGAIGRHGTSASGVILEVQNRAEYTGDNMAHELGHFMGLYHIQEVGQLSFLEDPISDTRTCSVPPEQLQWYDSCMDNIMFPSPLGFFNIDQSFSQEQTRVLRFAPTGR